MKGKFTRVTLLLILVAMVVTTLVLPLSAFAAGTATGYKSAGDVVYNTNGKYIYNWGARGERATFLSKYALQFYTGNYTFATLSKVSGGTSDSNAPSSSLYKQLQELMKSKHTYTNSYTENNNLLQYTDCENGGGTISSFYSGQAIGPSWSTGGWNKEHTWPNSKGLGGADEDDVMMIRPTATSENSSRGNLAYGESSGYYNPNNESNGKYDLRGDCARIFLYVYTRWGNTNGNGSYSTWGTRGVMESVSVLLKWMEQDPVDTWEMGRNDAVQAITGTRNVFVDYPEYAWL
ncbi:MAG: endonuclease, partial [Clostridia bacterium]|nr:endonuclease [Clostridia bacterium]